MWPLLIQLIPAALDAIPKVQALFGKTQDVVHGATKASAAMDLVTAAVPALEAALQVNPKWDGVIKAGISLGYEVLKATNQLPAMTAKAELQLAAAQPQPVPENPGS